MSQHTRSAQMRSLSARPRRARDARSRAPRLERLEDRTVLSQLWTVMTPLDGVNLPGSLRAEISQAQPGDTIKFAASLKGQTITLDPGLGALQVAKDLTIQGCATISGGDACRVVEVAPGVTVTLASVTITHGAAAEAGGILNAGDLTLRQCVVTTNQAKGGRGGGGILNQADARLTLSGSMVTCNVATAASGKDVFGGGLLNLGTALVNASCFTSNQARSGASLSFFGGSAGGAIDNFGGATLSVSCSTFTANQAIGADGYFGMGGAIDNNAGLGADRPSTAIISNSTFTGNIATQGGGGTANGGAIDNQGPGVTMSLTNCVLAGNRAIGGDGADGQGTLGSALGGGVLTGIFASMTITDCILVGNLAIGGNSGTPSQANPLTGSGMGGGICNFYQGDLKITGTTLAGNRAQGGTTTLGPGGSALGGGMENGLYSSMTMSRCVLTGNEANAGSGGTVSTDLPVGLGLGGALDLWRFATASVSNSTFIGNRAVGGSGGPGAPGGPARGGAISVGTNILLGYDDASTLTMRDSTIALNVARGGNGAVGGAGLGGGVMVCQKSTATLQDSNITLNFALGGNGRGCGHDGAGLGGGLFIDVGATVTAPKTCIKKNLASTAGNDVYGKLGSS